MKKHIILKISFVLLILLIVAARILFYLHSNYHNILIDNGILYYDDLSPEDAVINSYCYDFSNDKENRITIDGYDAVISYTPFNGGYACIARNYTQTGDIDDVSFLMKNITNDICLKLNKSAGGLYVGHNFAVFAENYFYLTNLYTLSMINLETSEITPILHDVENYMIVANKLVYSKGSEIFIYNQDDPIKIADGNKLCKINDDKIMINNSSIYSFKTSSSENFEYPKLNHLCPVDNYFISVNSDDYSIGFGPEGDICKNPFDKSKDNYKYYVSSANSKIRIKQFDHRHLVGFKYVK